MYRKTRNKRNKRWKRGRKNKKEREGLVLERCWIKGGGFPTHSNAKTKKVS